MKSNEAPEKIYLQQNTTTDCYEEWWPEWFEARAKDTDIEYTRTDAFFEKAKKWIKENFVNDQGLYCVITDYNTVNEMILAFVNYMKGE